MTFCQWSCSVEHARRGIRCPCRCQTRHVSAEQIPASYHMSYYLRGNATLWLTSDQSLRNPPALLPWFQQLYNTTRNYLLYVCFTKQSLFILCSAAICSHSLSCSPAWPYSAAYTTVALWSVEQAKSSACSWLWSRPNEFKDALFKVLLHMTLCRFYNPNNH